MIRSTPDLPQDDLHERLWKALNASVQQLKESWESGAPVPLAELVPEPSCVYRRRVLLELIKIDKELGWKSDRRKRVEAYLAEWAELLHENDVLQELLEAECFTRAVLGDAPDSKEIGERFPHLASQIDLAGIGA